MGKFYRANEEFTNFLITLGFTFHQREAEENSDIQYYTHHETGKQVRVDIKSNYITLLSNKGLVEDESSSFTDNQIKNFLEV